MNLRTESLVPVVILVGVLSLTAGAQQPKIYWADEVPKDWNGKWPAKFLTVPEKTSYTRTTSTLDLLEFVDVLKWNSENVHVFNAFTSPLRRTAPAIVLANPRVTSPQEAVKSGKPVMYLQGNIHPPEPEGTEALLMVMREILFGKRKGLLDNQIVIFLPIFNVDGTDTFMTQDGTPHIVGERSNAAGLDLNRDAVKLETVEANGLYQSILNRWDPVLLVDLHLMGRVKHGYANTYATSTVPAAHPGPRGYVWDTLFPAVREAVRRDFGLETFTHCLFDERNWPPTVWSHDNAIWSTEAKFIVGDYGLRNRMSIITETPGHPAFERRIYAQYAYVLALLEYTNAHGKEMQKTCRDADEDTVSKVRAQADSGDLRNWVEGRYESWGKVDILAYRTNDVAYLPGTSVRATAPGSASGPPEVIHGVEHLTKPVGTKEAAVPRAYLIPAELQDLIAKLRAHNIRFQMLDRPMKAVGEEFVVDKMVKAPRGGMTRLEGGFYGPATREFPAGTCFVDMAQPMANAAFYYLEPQSADGFVGWGLLDNYLRSLGVDQHPAVYPIFKFRKEIK
jgi:dipeptidyl-peptidase-4